MNQRNKTLKTSIDKDDFMQLPHNEQSFLIYNAAVGNEERITALEEKTSGWFSQSKSIIGGAIGGILFFEGKFLVGK